MQKDESTDSRVFSGNKFWGHIRVALQKAGVRSVAIRFVRMQEGKTLNTKRRTEIIPQIGRSIDFFDERVPLQRFHQAIQAKQEIALINIFVIFYTENEVILMVSKFFLNLFVEKEFWIVLGEQLFNIIIVSEMGGVIPLY